MTNSNDLQYTVAYITDDGDMRSDVMYLDSTKEYTHNDLLHEAEWRFNCRKILNIWNS